MKWPALSLKDRNLVPIVRRTSLTSPASSYSHKPNFDDVLTLYSKLGFGTGTAWYKDDPNDPTNTELIEVLKAALEKGFHHIDAADSYGTEREVGIAIKESGIPRGQLFITTKVLEGWKDVPGALDASLERLQLDYVDLYLLHNPYVIPDLADIQSAWKGLEAVKATGKARNIGVSNFQRNHLEAILETCSVVPAINQLEYHPYLQRSHDFIPWMRERGIEVSSFKTLAPVTVGKGGPLDEPLASIAAKHNTTTSAVVLNWAISQNIVPITTTTKKERMEEYIAAISLQLDREELEEITQIGLKHHFRWWGKDFFGPDDRS